MFSRCFAENVSRLLSLLLFYMRNSKNIYKIIGI
nr:MAG TPA: hypothetical protein [Caudoviricetes sp.]